MDFETDPYSNEDDLIQLHYDHLLQPLEGKPEIITRQRKLKTADGSAELGEFVFRDNLQTQVRRPKFVRVSPHTNCKDLVELIVTEMQALPPNLVLSLLTKPYDPKMFRLVLHTEQFIVGMENVIESSSLWIITHGQDCGLSKAIGESTEKYLEKFDYQNRWCEVLRRQLNKFRNVLLIGFVDEQALVSNGAKFTRLSNRLRLEINRKTFRDQNLLNWNHNLFIIVRNLDKSIVDGCSASLVDSFRCKFEHYLFGHPVPRLHSVDHRALQPRKLEIISVQTQDSKITVTINWPNPYFNNPLHDIFENFEISISCDGKETRRVAMKPKGSITTCELVIKSPFPPFIVFSVQSKTLFGCSEETKIMIDVLQIASQNQPPNSPNRLPRYMTKEYRGLPSCQTMEIDCVATCKDVTLSFIPFHPTTFHSIRVVDANGNHVGSKTLAACISKCQFSGLLPDTEYKLTVKPYFVERGQREQSLGGPFVRIFRTQKRSKLDCECRDYRNQPIATPLIYLIFGGGAETIKMVRHHLETKSTAMVTLAGTKGAADLIEITINLFKTMPTQKEINGFIRRILSRHVRMDLMKKSEDTDSDSERIVESVVENLIYIGKDCQKNRRIRISNVWCTKINLEKISKEFVKAWVVGGGNKGKDQSDFVRDTKLALDLNNCNVAKGEIFEHTSRYKSKIITNCLFELALLTNERELFVDLFLEYGFEIHKYLTEAKLKYIFEYEDEVDPYDRDFFITTTVEGIMGLTGDEDKLPEDFISEQLPDVIRHLTGLHTNFVGANPRIIFLVKSDNFSDGTGGRGKQESFIKMRNRAIIEREREALKMLTVYALLMNRFDLARYLWKHSSSPLLTALFCAAVYKRLSEKCHESYQKSLALQYSSRFTDLAVKLLDLSFTENEQITHESLQCKYPDWNDRSPIEFAHGVANKEFMAHPSCQKWITRTYFGGITLRETTLGIWHVPDFIKILGCSLLLFPMYFWINFSPIGKGDSMESKQTCKIMVTGTDRSYGEFGYKSKALSMSDLSGLFRNRSSPWEKLRETEKVGDENEYIELKVEEPVEEEEQKVGGRIEKIKQQSRLNRKRAIFIARVVASPPFWKKLMLLWGAPVTKFTTDGFFYFLYLLLFSIVTIWPTCGNLLLDLVFWIWTASVTFENARLCYTKSKTINHLPLRLSVIDVLMQFSFLTAFGYTKFFELWEGWEGSSPAKLKAIMGCFLIYFFLRVFRQYYPIHPKLGPAMVKLTYMITDDFVCYLYIFAVFMLSVGIAATAIIHPHHPLNRDLMTRILRRGVMALFRTDTRDLEGIDPSTCRINITQGTCSKLSSGISFLYDDKEAYRDYGISNPGCSVSTWIAWVLVLNYGYMSTVFLRSLLTAMFGITGRNVSAISEQIWMYDRYEIIMDYERKPRLPPPLSVISYLMSGFAFVYKKIAGTTGNCRYGKRREPENGESFQEFISMVSEFTRGDTSEWGQPKWEDDKGNQYWKLKAEKVFEMTLSKDKNEQRLKLLNLKADLIQRAACEEASTISVMRQLISEIVASREESQEPMTGHECANNALSRSSPYPTTRITRAHVRDECVPWSTETETGYIPPIINVPVDQSLSNSLVSRPSLIDIDNVDEQIQVEGDTVIQIEHFRNPIGRTGAAGRGCLEKLGPNKFLIVLLTHRNSNAGANRDIMFYSRLNGYDWTSLLTCELPSQSSIYGNFCEKLNPILAQSTSTNRNIPIDRFERAEFIEFLTKSIESADSLYDKNSETFSLIHNGYLDDKRNTDDAWVEAEVWNFHWVSSNIFENFIPIFQNNEFEWITLDSYNDILKNLRRQVAIVTHITGGHKLMI